MEILQSCRKPLKCIPIISKCSWKLLGNFCSFLSLSLWMLDPQPVCEFDIVWDCDDFGPGIISRMFWKAPWKVLNLLSLTAGMIILCKSRFSGKHLENFLSILWLWLSRWNDEPRHPVCPVKNWYFPWWQWALTEITYIFLALRFTLHGNQLHMMWLYLWQFLWRWFKCSLGGQGFIFVFVICPFHCWNFDQFWS